MTVAESLGFAGYEYLDLETLIEHFRNQFDEYARIYGKITVPMKFPGNPYSQYYLSLAEYLLQFDVLDDQIISGFVKTLNKPLIELFYFASDFSSLLFFSYYGVFNSKAKEQLNWELENIIDHAHVSRDKLEFDLHKIKHYAFNFFSELKDIEEFPRFRYDENLISLIWQISVKATQVLSIALTMPDYYQIKCKIFQNKKTGILKKLVIELVSSTEDDELIYVLGGCEKLIEKYPFIFSKVKEYEYKITKRYVKSYASFEKSIDLFLDYVREKGWGDDYDIFSSLYLVSSVRNRDFLEFLLDCPQWGVFLAGIFNGFAILTENFLGYFAKTQITKLS